MNLSYI